MGRHLDSEYPLTDFADWLARNVVNVGTVRMYVAGVRGILRLLDGELPDPSVDIGEMLAGRYAPATIPNYLAAWKQYIRYCVSIDVLPFDYLAEAAVVFDKRSVRHIPVELRPNAVTFARIMRQSVFRPKHLTGAMWSDVGMDEEGVYIFASPLHKWDLTLPASVRPDFEAALCYAYDTRTVEEAAARRDLIDLPLWPTRPLSSASITPKTAHKYVTSIPATLAPLGVSEADGVTVAPLGMKRSQLHTLGPVARAARAVSRTQSIGRGDEPDDVDF